MKLVLNNVKYDIPTSWKQVTLGKYMNFMQEVEGVEDELQKMLITISCLTDAPIELLQECKKNEIDKVIDALGKLTEEKTNTDLHLIFKIDGVDYGFHPNLHELKLKEFVDIDNKLNNGWESMHDVMAILYRPITSRKGDKYNIEDYDYVNASKRAELFKKELSIDTVNGSASFFLTIATNYIATTQRYFQKLNRKTKRKLLKQKKNNLMKNTGGTV